MIKAPDFLLIAIRKVLRGEKYISESLAEKVTLDVISGESGSMPRLSNREYQVMRRIAAGKALKEIAQELFLSVRTVSTYRARVLEKLNLKTNTELIRYALQNKLVD